MVSFHRKARPALCVAVLLTFTLAGGAMAQEQPLPFVVSAVTYTPVPPVIDGRLDDACWDNAYPMGPFRKLTLGLPAEQPAMGYMLYNDTHLFIGVRSEQNKMDAIKEETTQRDGPVPADECIEVFIIPPGAPLLQKFEERERYFHLIVNTLNTQYDEIGLQAPTSWVGNWQSAVHKGADYWELEIAVPFSEFGVQPRDGDVWSGNISRNNTAIREYTTWAPLQRSFHDKANFGRLVFTRDLEAAIREIDRIECQALQNGLLHPMVEDIRAMVSRMRTVVQGIPAGAEKSRMERQAGILTAAANRLARETQALTPADFRTRWGRLFRQVERTEYQAQTALDEAYMLAATDGGRRSSYVFVTPAITNHKLLANQWPRDARMLSSLRVAATAGEYKSATFSVYAVRDIPDVTLEISDLRSASRVLPATILDPYVVKNWYQAGRDINDLGEKLLTPELLLKDDDLVRVDYRTKRNYARLHPGSTEYVDLTLTDSSNLADFVPRDADELLPFTIEARSLKQIWLKALIPQDAAPGVYTGTITLHSAGEVFERVPITVQVLPFTLADPILEYSIYYRGRLTEDGTGHIGSERKTREQFLAEMRDMMAHGVNNPTIYQRYDETLLNAVFDLREEAGMNDPRVYTLGITTGAPKTEEELNRLREGVRQWLEFIRARGYEELYVYGIDEASGDQLAAQRAAWQAVRDEGAKMYVACYRDFFNLVGDILDVPVWSGRPDPEVAKKVHSVGHKIFNYGHPQLGLEEPETYRRNYGLFLWQMGYDGVMNYAYQHSFGHEWNDFDSDRYRDHTMAYPTENGVIGTVQWCGFREAVDDVRYLATLLEHIERGQAEGGPRAATARAAQQWLDAIDAETADLYMVRSRMIDWILKLREPVPAQECPAPFAP